MGRGLWRGVFLARCLRACYPTIQKLFFRPFAVTVPPARSSQNMEPVLNSVTLKLICTFLRWTALPTSLLLLHTLGPRDTPTCLLGFYLIGSSALGFFADLSLSQLHSKCWSSSGISARASTLSGLPKWGVSSDWVVETPGCLLIVLFPSLLTTFHTAEDWAGMYSGKIDSSIPSG